MMAACVNTMLEKSPTSKLSARCIGYVLALKDTVQTHTSGCCGEISKSKILATLKETVIASTVIYVRSTLKRLIG